MIEETNNERFLSKESFVDNKEKPNQKLDDWKSLDHIVWFNVFRFVILHMLAGYGLYLCFNGVMLSTIIFGEFSMKDFDKYFFTMRSRVYIYSMVSFPPKPVAGR
jgi:hypothetical protein